MKRRKPRTKEEQIAELVAIIMGEPQPKKKKQKKRRRMGMREFKAYLDRVDVVTRRG